MLRLFDQHDIRRQKELDGVWHFEKGNTQTGENAGGKEYEIPVPGCWEQHPELLNYRGCGTFTKKVHTASETNVKVTFYGVSHTADVYLDNVFITHHYNAFTGFDAVIPRVAAGEHVLKVVVDNSFSQASALHVPNDYQTYGGIIRPVSFEEVPDGYIENVHFDCVMGASAGRWEATISVKLRNLSEHSIQQKLSITLAGKQLTKEVEVCGQQLTVVEFHETFSSITPWTMKEPKLYDLLVQLLREDGKILDDFRDRIGFRQVSIQGQKLLLNGEMVFLKGFNRHEDFGTTGSAVPFQNIVQDMDLMQEAGANAVRTCHYPNDARFLDLCDQRGMLVWEENHARGFDLVKMQNPNFERQCQDCIDEMIDQHYNHPAIVIWGILNECASETPEGRSMYQKQFQQIKSLDQTRPTTFATCRHFKDICLDLPDIVSFNMYSGWYQDIGVKERHEQEMDWISSAGGEGKPVIVSEFGAAAIYGFRDRGRCKWSEERQADLIRENLEVYEADERLTGVFIWQFADCKVTEEEWFSTRARCHNNKGLVDEYRRPKEAFDVVKELFLKMKG